MGVQVTLETGCAVREGKKLANAATTPIANVKIGWVLTKNGERDKRLSLLIKILTELLTDLKKFHQVFSVKKDGVIAKFLQHHTEDKPRDIKFPGGPGVV